MRRNQGLSSSLGVPLNDLHCCIALGWAALNELEEQMNDDGVEAGKDCHDPETK